MRRDPLRDAIEKLKQDFPGKSRSWIKRAIMRLGDVRELKFGLYLVEGRRELCDWKPLYQVWYSERGGRWYCTCYFSTFGFARQRDVCTHVAAVMLYRRYKKALEKAERKRVYVAEGEVECKGRIEANGELHIKPAVDRVDLTFFANPKYKIFVVSEMRRIVVRCSGYEILELEGEEVPLATAKFLVERFYERG
ncbi:hypothetical protein [Pyrobaculum aerophilum]|uniref:SWIM-type domain-containing protein n=1 Tax=Pyrobaculum aerophilum TaxID=13773 RepID=A0A371QWA0_9CREN|nr:hypothetical protein [Pyrobaculum aerophilum]RFA94574.1 hypothetical protein CGL52_14180 [Pyrobaculum aerophilum]RFA96767.1 hypothetical protein CGL51_04420 [Pyrobaculum aerophilum]